MSRCIVSSSAHKAPILCALMAMLGLSLPVFALAENVAITFDDLPLNGTLPPGTSRTQLVQRVLKILQQQHVPRVYGFVNAKRFEGSQDGADALKLWVAAGERVGNHTYSHPDLNKETSGLFLADVYQNEPVLERLSVERTGGGSVTPSSARETRSPSAAVSVRACEGMVIA